MSIPWWLVNGLFAMHVAIRSTLSVTYQNKFSIRKKKQKGDEQSNIIHSTKFACVTHGMCQLKKNMENWMSIINFKLSNQFIPSNWKALWQLWRSARSGDFGDFSNHTNWNLSFFSLLNFGEKLPRSLGRVSILR